MNDIIYLDNNATMQIDERVFEAMTPYLTNLYANASSKHLFGQKANESIKNARNQIAKLINCESREIIFTSGATESINLAIKGVSDNYNNKGKHIVTVTTEHYAVLDTCKYLETKGYTVTYLPVQKNGLLDLNDLSKAIKDDTILICVMFVNNEIGVIQPIKEIYNLAHKKNIIFMTDATQSVGKTPLDVNSLGIDLMAFSGHKIYGPKGIGALYIRGRGENKVKLKPFIYGGGHERGLRSGTLNVPGIVGLGKACEIAKNEMNKNALKIKRLRDILETELLKIDNSFVNGDNVQRLYNVTNICFKGIDADAIITGLKNIAVSTGSACSSASIEPSHVLKAIGLSDKDAYSSIRFSLGKFNNEEEIRITIERVNEVIKRLKQMI